MAEAENRGQIYRDGSLPVWSSGDAAEKQTERPPVWPGATSLVSVREMISDNGHVTAAVKCRDEDGSDGTDGCFPYCLLLVQLTEITWGHTLYRMKTERSPVGL